MNCHLLACAILFGAVVAAEEPLRQAPAYTVDSIVNSATNQAGPIAPNTLVSIYGTGLCMAERAVSAEDLRDGTLPNVLPGTGCRVLVGNYAASIYYASPKQINFLVPSMLLAMKAEVRVVMNALAGPAVEIHLSETAPGLFQLDQEFAVATHPDGSVVTLETPARPGGIIVLYATGLGRTTPAAIYSKIATTAARLVRSADFRVLLDGAAVESSAVQYVGLTPGFAGLYQVNLRIPEEAGDNPEIRIGFEDTLSPEGLRVPVARPDNGATLPPDDAFHK